VEDKFDELTQTLDAAGINRKEYVVNHAKAFAEELHGSIVDALTALTDDETLRNDLANKFIAMAMGAFAAESPEEVIEEEPLPEEAVEIMADEDEVIVEDPEDETVEELSKQVTALAKESAEIYKYMGELIPAMIGMAETVKALTPLVQQTKEVETLKADFANLKKTLAMAPRIASKDNGSVLKAGTDKAAKEKLAHIESQIKDGIEGTKTVLGVKVKG
jgi:hypothetical protein